MNRTKIEWTDYTTNPLGQGCDRGCWYCYAKRGARRNYYMHMGLYRKGKRREKPCLKCRDFIPHIHIERLKDPWKVKTPSKVFVCSTSDLFASWTQPRWREPIIRSLLQCPVEHQFQLLTKDPQNIPGKVWPGNWWIGATVTEQSEVWKIDHIRSLNVGITFVSFEPLLGPIKADLEGIDWVIIGKLTGSKKVKLEWDWIKDIVLEATLHGIPVFMKNNILQSYPDNYLVQNFPAVIK